MIVKVALPFKEWLYICNICGEAGTDHRSLFIHARTPAKGIPEITRGAMVELWVPGDWDDGRSALSEEPYSFLVTRIFYARRRGTLFFGFHSTSRRWVDLHELCVDLKAYEFGSSEIPYRDFLLWQEGDVGKLRAAGLVPEKRPRLKLVKR